MSAVATAITALFTVAASAGIGGYIGLYISNQSRTASIMPMLGRSHMLSFGTARRNGAGYQC